MIHEVRIGRIWPWLSAVFVIMAAAAYQLHRQGRLWRCACGQVLLWAGDTWSADNSQHLFDPYGFTHVLHGVAFCGLVALLFPRMSLGWQFCLAIFLEAVWEVIENTDLVINRYRGATAALGYQGDTIINSLGDTAACGVGFVLARHLGFRRSLALFVVTEIMLIVWIRDSLLLNVLMLVYPVEALREWQAGR